MKCKRSALRAFCAALLASLSLLSCAQKESRIVLKTNNVEFVSCAELFNASQDKIKLLVYYQDELIKSSGSDNADLLAGSFLQQGIEKKYFASLNSIVKENGSLDPNSFYPALLQSGQLNKKQYLLPVSFNLPALVFYSQNNEILKDYPMLSFDDIKSLSKKFNAQTKDGSYASMGFGPLWSQEFLYLIFKDSGVYFNALENSIKFTENAFSKSVDYTREWIESVNGSANNEQDFAFKYLYMPFYSQVQSGRCLFSYANSRQIFSLSRDQIHELDFRWICNNNKIQIEDDFVSIGIRANSKNKAAAKKFIVWLMSEDAQKQILDRKVQMNLSTDAFGIAGGFSALQNVTERLFPLYYRALLSNTPLSDRLCAPQNFVGDWAKVKSMAVEPFILDSVCDNDSKRLTLTERYQNYLDSEAK